MLSGRQLKLALLAVVVAYGALLRFDALTLTYGPVQHPGWLRAVQETRGPESVLRPDPFRWDRWEGRYISDPYTYLRYAREMRSFYAAHRREPLFPFATKVSLWLLGDQDVAVSFASMFFSVLAIIATCLLGRAAFGYWVGLGAAAAMAIEYDVVTWGIGGWRDDAFTCAVVLSALALLQVMRVPSRRRLALLGAVAAAACLTRITSLSFLVPGFAWLLLVMPGSWPYRVRAVGVAALLAALLAGPYLVNCWRTYGDPLYAINVHADVYRAAEGQTVQSNQTAGEYIKATLASRPWSTIDTALQGMTLYPFTNKWTGFDRWTPLLGRALSWLSVAGLFLFLGSPEGRLLLVVLAGSLVPYALTWRLIFDWRFTEHAYPFFLIGAFYAVRQAVRLADRLRLREIAGRRPARGPALAWSGAAVAVLGVSGAWIWMLPPRVAAEALRAGEPVSIGLDARDRIYFAGAWSPPAQQGNVVARVSEGRRVEIELPLPAAQAYSLALRMDPHPAPSGPGPLPVVRVMLNDQLLAVVELEWNPERMGAYRVSVPAAAVRPARNRLALIPGERDNRPARIRLWYVRILPPTS